MINAVIESKKATLRFNGRQYRYDMTLTAKHKQALKRVLETYKLIGGT
jgi:hypothetical protein